MKYHRHFSHLVLTLIATTSALTGCGGGGGSSSPAPESNSGPVLTPPNNTTQGVTFVAPQTSATAPTYTGVLAQDELDAFNELNAQRVAAGLGVLNANPALQQAATNHANYLGGISAQSYTDPHAEVSTNPGYTGDTPWTRVQGAGYQFSSEYEMAEDLSKGLPSDKLLGLLAVPYHRIGLLAHEHVDVGIGYPQPTSPYGVFTVVESGTTGPEQDMTAPDKLSVYPADGATDIPLIQGMEVPNPMPESLWCAPTCPGYTVSIQSQAGSLLTVQQFTLSGPTGVISTKLIDKSDTEIQNLNAKNWALIIPLGALTPETTYTAVFTGSVTKNNQTQQISKTWSFTTRSNTVSFNPTKYLQDGSFIVSVKTPSGTRNADGLSVAFKSPNYCAPGYKFLDNLGDQATMISTAPGASAPGPNCVLGFTAKDAVTGVQATLDVQVPQ